MQKQSHRSDGSTQCASNRATNPAELEKQIQHRDGLNCTPTSAHLQSLSVSIFRSCTLLFPHELSPPSPSFNQKATLKSSCSVGAVSCWPQRVEMGKFPAGKTQTDFFLSFFPDFLISWVLWDNAGEEGADLGLRTPPSTILGGSVATREAAS